MSGLTLYFTQEEAFSARLGSRVAVLLLKPAEPGPPLFAAYVRAVTKGRLKEERIQLKIGAARAGGKVYDLWVGKAKNNALGHDSL